MVQRFYRPIFSGDWTTPTEVGQLYRSSVIPFICFICLFFSGLFS